MVRDDRPRVVARAPSGPHGPRDVLDVFRGDTARAGAEQRIESADRTDDFAPHRHVGAVNETGRDEASRFDFGWRIDITNRQLRIRGVVQDDTAADDTHPADREYFRQRLQEIWPWIAIVIGKSQDVTTRVRQPDVFAPVSIGTVARSWQTCTGVLAANARIAAAVSSDEA